MGKFDAWNRFTDATLEDLRRMKESFRLYYAGHGWSVRFFNETMKENGHFQFRHTITPAMDNYTPLEQMKLIKHLNWRHLDDGIVDPAELIEGEQVFFKAAVDCEITRSEPI